MPAERAVRDGQPADFELIETLRWEPDTGFVRLERHLARLYASAGQLGFECDPDHVRQALGRAPSSGIALRTRLTLSPDGAVSVSAQPYEGLSSGRVWKLLIARQTLDSGDVLLRHKTSRREVYTHARSEYLVQQAHEVLLMNERGELCEGTITNLFADFGDGMLVTPRLDCGLLPGVLRAELLHQGRAREDLLTLDRIEAAKALFVGNSLRGLIPARMATTGDD